MEKNSQELNLNLISLDKFERLPQKNQCEDETKTLKKKKKKHQGKKLLNNDSSVKVLSATTEAESTSSNASKTSKESTITSKTSTATTPATATTTITEITVPTVSTPLPDNQHINAIKKKDGSVKLPPRPPNPFYPHPHPHPQRFQFYPPRHPQINMKGQQPSQFYIPKELINNVQPHFIVNPKNRKQTEIGRQSYPIINPREQTRTEISRNHISAPKEKPQLFDPNRPRKSELKYMIPPDMNIETNEYISISFPTTELWFDHLNSTMTSSSRTHENNHCIAIDCEMVGVGEKGKYSVLARVSIVNYYGEVLLDKFVKSTREITDYRTQFSGITPELLTNASDFKQVQREVEKIKKDHIVVGQSIYFDFKALKTRHPEHLIRDTSYFNTIFGIETEKGVTPSLKKLAKDILGINIQEGEHDSIEDARASMILYRHRQAGWEEHLKTNGFSRLKECKFCGSSFHTSKRCLDNKRKLKDDKDKMDKDNLDQNIKNNDVIDYDEYNRDPNTSKYYSYSYPNNYNANYAPVTYQHYNIIS